MQTLRIVNQPHGGSPHAKGTGESQSFPQPCGAGGRWWIHTWRMEGNTSDGFHGPQERKGRVSYCHSSKDEPSEGNSPQRRQPGSRLLHGPSQARLRPRLLLTRVAPNEKGQSAASFEQPHTGEPRRSPPRRTPPHLPRRRCHEAALP